MERVKIYVDETRTAFVTCGTCGKSRELNFSGKEIPHASLVTCSCGSKFIVTFEKRQYYRKQLDAIGTCFVEGGPPEGIAVRMKDISLGGVYFTVPEGHAFEPNQKLGLVFRLKGETIRQSVSVRNTGGENVRAETIAMDEHSRKIIGFYLLP
ncbi:MAG: PilZ domain-containing protein [Syntrophobacteraceae bacterium]